MVDNTTTSIDEETADDQLAKLPPERLATMLRDKRKAEAEVRGRLRDVETERDGLKATVGGFQRSALHELAASAGVAPSALADLDDLVALDGVLSDDGLIDSAKASTALQTLRGERPHLFSPGVTVSGAESFAGVDDTPDRGVSWGDVLRA